MPLMILQMLFELINIDVLTAKSHLNKKTIHVTLYMKILQIYVQDNTIL